MAIATAGREPAEPALGPVALGVVVASPGVLALLGFRDRPDLWLTAFVAAVPLSMLSMAGLTFPLLPAAVVLALAWSHRPPPAAPSRVHPIVVTPLVAAAMVAAAFALFMTEDPVSWETASASGASSDVITNREALVSLATTITALVAGWMMTRPRTAATARPRATARAG